MFPKDAPVSSFTRFRVDERPAGRRSLKFIISLDPAIRHRSSVTNKTPPFPQIKDEKMAPYGSLARLQSCMREFDFPFYWLSKILGFMRFWDFTFVNKMEVI